MLVAVRLLRHSSRILSWREVVNRPILPGDPRMEQYYDQELCRHVRMARLLDPTTPGYAKQPPTLHDARLIGMTPSAYSRTGFERVDGVLHAQS